MFIGFWEAFQIDVQIEPETLLLILRFRWNSGVAGDFYSRLDRNSNSRGDYASKKGDTNRGKEILLA